MVKIRWALQAADELEDICAYLEKDSPQYSRLFASKIIETLNKLSKFPKIGRIVPEIEIPKIRKLIFKSYRIIYRVKGEIIEIVSIFHDNRNFSENKFFKKLKED